MAGLRGRRAKAALTRKPWRSAKGRRKIKKTMDEWKTGGLHSGSKHGPVVRNRRQAIAIALSQARKEATR